LDELKAHYDDIAAEPGDVAPETIAAILAAGAIAVRQYRQDGRFDREAHKQCLMKRGRLSADAADMLTEAIEDALTADDSRSKAGEAPQGWRRDILAAVIRSSLRQPASARDARAEESAASSASRTGPEGPREIRRTES
jgi:hypothetical protein